MKKWNFSAGPSILSDYTISRTAEAITDFAGTGLSVLEVSHRSSEFVAVIEEARRLVKELLDLPDGYTVLFLGGGASMQFCMVPYNLLAKKAAYLDTGRWAHNAIKEARMFGEVDVVASSRDDDYSYIPRDYVVPADADYFHFTSNNTIYGTELRTDPDAGGVRLVADMSSDIFTRRIDVSKYDLIYAGAQKNLAPAGVALVIVRNDALGHAGRPIPSILDYRSHVEKESMFNTPPVLPVFSALQTLRWYKMQGGVDEMERRDKIKAAILYEALDTSRKFAATVTRHEDRSIMNVRFIMTPEYLPLEDDFLQFAAERGIVGIKGHRTVGGFRASIYNAMPVEGVEALVEAIKEYDRNR